MSFLDRTFAPSKNSLTSLDGGTLSDTGSPAIEIGVGFALEVGIPDQRSRPLVVHDISNSVLIATKIVLAFQCLLKYIQDTLCLDGITINRIFPGELGIM